jgi:hypothetical protein
MRRSLLLLTTIALGVLMVSSVAQAASPTAKCLQEAQTLTGTTLTGYNVVVGNNRKNDDFSSKATGGADLFCGRGGDDSVPSLGLGDIFIGGVGGDTVTGSSDGTFYGGADNDYVFNNYAGATFNGEGGNDEVTNDLGGTFNQEDLPA